MMSFMRQDSEKEVRSADGQKGDDVSGRVGDRQEDYLLPSNNMKSVNRNTIVLTVLFAAGILLLVFMIKRVNPSVANAAITDEALQIESAVASLTGIRAEMGGKLSEVVRKVSSLSDIDQVEVTELQKNPFRHNFLVDIGGIEFDMGENKFQKSSGQKIGTKGVSLRLWTITSSEKGRSCMINDEILYEGDSISGLRVKRIGDDFVELSSNGARVLLRMSK